MKRKHGIIIAGSGRGLYLAELLGRIPELRNSCSVRAMVDIRTENHETLPAFPHESGLDAGKIITDLQTEAHRFFTTRRRTVS